MKANELMIGDWLRTSRGIAKVIAVDKIGLTFEIDGGDFDIDEYDEEEWFDALPLTAEILEKNGFECRGAWCLPGEDLGLRQDGDSWGLLPYYAVYDALAFCHIKNVHELQHALRLCGIEKEITI